MNIWPEPEPAFMCKPPYRLGSRFAVGRSLPDFRSDFYYRLFSAIFLREKQQKESEQKIGTEIETIIRGSAVWSENSSSVFWHMACGSLIRCNENLPVLCKFVSHSTFSSRSHCNLFSPKKAVSWRLQNWDFFICWNPNLYSVLGDLGVVPFWVKSPTSFF